MNIEKYIKMNFMKDMKIVMKKFMELMIKIVIVITYLIFMIHILIMKTKTINLFLKLLNFIFLNIIKSFEILLDALINEVISFLTSMMKIFI